MGKIAFSGSTGTGRAVRRRIAGTGKPLTLGGKSPFIVFVEADLGAAVEGVVDAIWFIQGQACCPSARILVAETRGQPWPEGLIEEADPRLLLAIETELRGAERLRHIDPPLAVASSAPPRLRRSFERRGLLQAFRSHVYSAGQVARGKPAPSMSLLAAVQAGVAPRARLVIEAGVAGGRAVGYTRGGGHSHCGRGERLLKAGALEVVAHVRDRPRWVAALRTPRFAASG